ncbi:class I SAM-dependent methyltransferase [Duganella alba]|uniref:class I SAM-dependent methyltransferase n=1 Tax=Duganella alba TaxID=2666081 RepID=UPI001E46AFE3|nr:methyltransferase [Duganella alba]
MKSALVTVAVAPLLLSAPAQAQAPSAAVTAAVADKARPEKDAQQDAVRHPAELLAFARVKAGDVVVDVWPGGGYWSRLFSTVVGPKGKVVAYVPAEITGFKSDPLALAKAIATEAGHGNVAASSYPLAEQPGADMLNQADVVWTFENYHDLHDSFMQGADVNAFNQAVFKRLKAGGYYIVADHAAAAGSGLKNIEDLHRIDPAAVKAEVEKAGFVLDGESAVLAVQGDDHQLKIFDPAVRGKTDRFVLRFKKPLP